MKRAIYTLTALLLISAVSVQAQPRGGRAQAPQRTAPTGDATSILKTIEKLEAESQDSRRAARVTTWLDLGKAYVDAFEFPAKNIFYSMDKTSLLNAYGEPGQASTETIGETAYEKIAFPNVDVYLKDGTVSFWKVKTPVVSDALPKATAAYEKAYSLDNSTKNELLVANGLNSVADFYKMTAENLYTAEEYIPGAENFLAAFNTLALPPVNMYDTATLFNVGFLYAIGDDSKNGVKYLTELLDKGYESGGETYFYLLHAYMAEKNYDAAKEIAKQAISKYPNYVALVDLGTNVFVEAGEDPTSILPYIRQAVAEDPNNAELHAGLGRVLDKLGDIDGAIAEFQKALSIEPNDFTHNFNSALMIMKKADAAAAALRDAQITSQADYDAKLATVNAEYEKALAPMEKAHQLNPAERNPVELMRSLYFRLRDMKPEYLQNYEKYDALLKSM